MEPYLLNSLPMVDMIVLDEADRMVADGHFKELKFILEHIYMKRVEFKKEALNRNKQRKEEGKKGVGNEKLGNEIVREKLLESGFDAKKNFKVGKNLVSSEALASIDQSKIVDLDDENDQEFMEKLKENNEDIIIDLGEQTKATTKLNPHKKGMSKKDK